MQQGNTITRQDILDFGDEGFLLEGVLSKEECQFYINQGEEKGFGNIPDVKQTYRDSQRYVLENKVRPFPMEGQSHVKNTQ